jgi:hypothetical protein
MQIFNKGKPDFRLLAAYMLPLKSLYLNEYYPNTLPRPMLFFVIQS